MSKHAANGKKELEQNLSAENVFYGQHSEDLLRSVTTTSSSVSDVSHYGIFFTIFFSLTRL